MANDSCSICHEHDGSVSGVIKGEYIDGVCRQCFDALLADQSVSSGWADYMRNRDFEDKQADIVQPYSKDGTPNQDFIKLYPTKAAEMFSEKDLRNSL